MQLRMKTNNCGELNLSNIDQEVTLSGWVDCVRDLGGMIFIELRDRTGFFQLVSDPQKIQKFIKFLKKSETNMLLQSKVKLLEDLKKLTMKNFQQVKLKFTQNM